MNQESKDKLLFKYRKTVEGWGEERVQEDVPDLPKQQKIVRRNQKNDMSEFDKYVGTMWLNSIYKDSIY